MRRTALLCAVLLLSAGCARQLSPAEREEETRAELELQSVMDMVNTRAIPPVDFELGSATLKESSYELLDKVAQVLLEHRKFKLIVSGHTDDTGSAEFNEEMSLQRAGAVKQYLAEKGVYPDFIKVYGFGSRRPIVKGTSDKDRALNRRVEFRITAREWESVY
jgi:outer membrane protein OmpA-like peptidoglycan-associated protein